MNKKILYLVCLVLFVGIIACTTKNDTGTTIDESTGDVTPIIDEVAVDSIEDKIEDLEKEIDAFLESID